MFVAKTGKNLGPKPWFTLDIRIADFPLVTYVNECLKLKYETNMISHLPSIHLYMEFTQSHLSEEAILDFYDKC